jgi:hypothetical protein
LLRRLLATIKLDSYFIHTLRPCRASRFGQVGVDFEQMTTESYAKKQFKDNNKDSDNNEGSGTETEGEHAVTAMVL